MIDKVVGWDYERIREESRMNCYLPRIYTVETQFDKEWPVHVMLDLGDNAYTIQKCKDIETARDFIRRFYDDWDIEMEMMEQ